MTDQPYRGVQLDEQAIRVLAHPLRSRILSRLRVIGPATATELATELSTNTGATSYHLRALEAVGLVVDTDDGVGKRRIWRASSEYHSWTNSAYADDPDTRTALDWLQRHYVRQFAERAERWLDVVEAWPTDWVDALGVSDTLVTVTPEQLRELSAELDAVVARYRHAGDDDPRARRVLLALFANPAELDPPARG